MDRLKKYSLVYLASPYSKYWSELDAAHEMACRCAAELIRCGIPTYSPIAHSHPIAEHGDLDPRDHTLWLPVDREIALACEALVVATMTGWRDSIGVAYERGFFDGLQAPTYFIDPETFEISEVEP